MTTQNTAQLVAVLKDNQADLLAEWLREQKAAVTQRKDLMNDNELQEQSQKFLQFLIANLESTQSNTITGPGWTQMRDLLTGISRSRAAQGFSPSETATFVFSFKQPLFSRIQKAHRSDTETVVDLLWHATVLLDKLGLFTIESFLKTREDMIARQQEEMLELSTPVVKLWDGILALPMIGTLDSARTQVVMETLLQKIVETGSEVAIIDITGVPTVDTLVAQHLLKTVAAARLMGADCIISGIRPQIAQTIVHLAIDLSNITTKANLADAFAVALQRTGKKLKGQTSKGEQNSKPVQTSGNGAAIYSSPSMNQ